jgi:hypothetical protein
VFYFSEDTSIPFERLMASAGSICWLSCNTLLQVDISTMLEEAVHYVRFLQQQIKVGPI